MAVLQAFEALSFFKNNIVLDEEAFDKASQDFTELAGKIVSLEKDIEEMLDELQAGDRKSVV